VLILDCCFSGAFGEALARDDGAIPLKEQLGAEGRVVLASTSAVDYSFEEKGADLSIYTRYLVEGLATGAADEDGHGWITVAALHRYAGCKVKETSPVMSPCLITLKDEGYRIRIARSPQDDPRLKYRKEAERRATAAEFTIPAQRLLRNLRLELGLSNAEAEAIEVEVLKPYRDYQRKQQEYQDTLRECVERESPLSQRTLTDLIDYRAHLQLKPADAAKIEQAALRGQSLEGDIAELERQRQAETQSQSGQKELETEAERQIQAIWAKVKQLWIYDKPEFLARPNQTKETKLSREKGINYTRLRDLLKDGKWREADKETYRLMITNPAVGKKEGQWFEREELLNFPCEDLRTIDELWVSYSQGKFGFSVQKQIYMDGGAKLDGKNPDDKIWHDFCIRVGWRKDGSYLSYSDLKANPSFSPAGEFPFKASGLEWWVGDEYFVSEVVFWDLFSRAETCGL
jgi:hypothetical protein